MDDGIQINMQSVNIHIKGIIIKLIYNMIPKVSIITVCYNCHSIIKDTCMSVLSQTYQDYEYIIVDGASKDRTCEIIEEVRCLADAMNVPFQVVSERDKGVYDAMNKGARMAKGEYVLYMNAGDFFYSENALENLCFGLHEGVDILYGDTEMNFNWGKIVNKPQYPTIEEPMPFIHQSCLTRRALLLDYPFDLSYKIIADHNLYYQLKVNNAVFNYVPTIVSLYDAREGISANNPYWQYIEHAKIHGYDKQWWYPFRRLYYLVRFGLQMRIKKVIPKNLNDKIERKRREKLFNAMAKL